jgi:hypothetical protein
MNETTLQLDRKTYAPGDTLRGVVSLDAQAGPVESAEVVVSWLTEGKGDGDRAEVYCRVFGGPFAADGEDSTFEFTVRLPVAPLSYDGVIVKIRWVVELRVRHRHEDTPALLKIVERLLVPVRRTAAFRLGDVKTPKELAT